MVNLRLRHEDGRGFDPGVCAVFLGLALFWMAVGFALSRLF